MAIEKAKKRTTTPRSPEATTVKPMTAPPEKAICRAGFRPVFAASIVLTFAAVAIFIPPQPALAERMAPNTKQTQVCQPPFTLSPFGGSS